MPQVAEKMTFPSSQVALVDVPETQFINDELIDDNAVYGAKFIYNFYVDDESVNDTAVTPTQLKAAGGAFVTKGIINDASVVDKFVKYLPRVVKFRFNTVAANFGPGDPEGMAESLLSVNPHLIHDNLDRVYREEVFSNARYTGLIFNDTGIDQKVYTLLSATLAQETATKNAQTLETLNNAVNEFAGFNVTEFSLLDQAKFLNEVTNDFVDAEFIAEGLNDIKAIAATYITPDQQDEIIRQAFVKTQRAKLGVQLNDKFIWTSVNSVLSDKMSTYNNDISPDVVSKASQIQDAAIASFIPKEVVEDEYDIALNSIIEPIPVNTPDLIVGGKIIGYIIDKIEVNKKGKVIKHPPIIVENNQISSAIDVNVAYGRTYMYAIRSVALMFLNADAADTEANLRIAILASSRNSAYREIRTFDAVPPPSPADFRPVWDHQKRELRLMWAFPLNKQRDIRRFQVLRRKSLSAPFELLAELDFDKSAVRYENFENVGDKRISINAAQTWFVDAEFTKRSDFIYTLCSVDAHGLTSNYSSQLRATFNGLENRLNLHQVSASGAAKQYPNMLIPEFLTESIIKDSGSDKVQIYFDPEVIELKNGAGHDMTLIAKNNDAKYRLSLINLDLQQSEGVDIIINDLQTTDN